MTSLKRRSLVMRKNLYFYVKTASADLARIAIAG